jgi:hypothetical protein
MQTVLFLIGVILVGTAITKLLQRREDYENELENAEYERKSAYFWGLSAESQNQRIEEIRERGYGTRMERFKFAAGAWSMAIIGGLMLLFVWLNREPPKEPWQSDIGYLFLSALVVGYWSYYWYLRTIQKLERRMRWHEELLSSVKRHLDARREPSEDDGLSLGEILQKRLDVI